MNNIKDIKKKLKAISDAMFNIIKDRGDHFTLVEDVDCYLDFLELATGNLYLLTSKQYIAVYSALLKVDLDDTFEVVETVYRAMKGVR